MGPSNRIKLWRDGAFLRIRRDFAATNVLKPGLIEHLTDTHRQNEKQLQNVTVLAKRAKITEKNVDGDKS